MVGAPFLASAVFLHRARELLPLREALTRQAATDALLGQATFQNFFGHKLELVRQRRPVVLALGSSRMMQLRAESFRVSFANAGGAMNSVEEGRRFVAEMATAHVPDVILLGLDFWWFHPSWRDPRPAPDADANTLTPTRLMRPLQWLATGKLVAADVAHVMRGETRNAYTTYPGIGLLAIQSSSGFRPDGSYHYGNHYFGLYENLDVRFRITLARVASRDSLFPAGGDVDAGRVAHLRALLDALHARRGRIIVFLPPLAPPVRRAAQERNDVVRLMEAVRREAQAMVRDLGGRAEFHDFDTAIANDPCEFVDGIHGGDVTFQRFLLAVADRDPRSAVAEILDTRAVRRAVEAFRGHAVSMLDRARYTAREGDFLGLGCVKP